MEILTIILLFASVVVPCSGQCTSWGWTFHDQKDIVGEDIRSVPSADRNGCQLPCLQTANCVSYSWANGVCYLKRGSTPIVSNANVYSAVLCWNQPCTTWGWRFYDSTDIPGSDIKSVAASNRNGCQDPCKNTPGCVAYSWSNGMCYLKNGVSSFKTSSNVYSAIMCKATTKCGDNIIRGVNLGSWLVLESWMVPSLFSSLNVGSIAGKVIDEWTLAQYVDKTVAKQTLERHWNTWFQKSDLVELYNSGISHIRIPVGYWLVDVQAGEPFPPPPATDNDGQRFYLKRLMQWADQIGLKVLIDLHGAPGSQNGQDHSGHSGAINWLNNGNVGRTVNVIGKLAGLMESWIMSGSIRADTLYGIELLNEPAYSVWDTCKNSFYNAGYHKIRDNYFLSLPDELRPWVTVMDGFQSVNNFIGYMSEPNYHHVSMDSHQYQCFGSYWNSVAEKPDGWNTHLQFSCDYHNDVAKSTLAMFVGEFSLSVTDCSTKSVCDYYNKPFATYSADYVQFLKNYFLAQIDSFEYGRNGIGWFYWSAKLEDQGTGSNTVWNYLYLLRNGIIPTDLCNRKRYCKF